MKKRHMGNTSAQLPLNSLHMAIMDFKVQWNLSTNPLLSGLYTEVLICWIPFFLQKATNTFPVNCGPLSETMVPGNPLRLNISVRCFTIMGAVMCLDEPPGCHIYTHEYVFNLHQGYANPLARDYHHFPFYHGCVSRFGFTKLLTCGASPTVKRYVHPQTRSIDGSV